MKQTINLIKQRISIVGMMGVLSIVVLSGRKHDQTVVDFGLVPESTSGIVENQFILESKPCALREKPFIGPSAFMIGLPF